MRIAWSVAGIIGLVAVVWMAIMVFRDILPLSSFNEELAIPVNSNVYVELVKVEAGSFNMGATSEMQIQMKMRNLSIVSP